MSKMVHMMQVQLKESSEQKYKGVPKVDRHTLEHGIQTLPGPIPANDTMKHALAPATNAPGTIYLEPSHPYRTSALGKLHPYSTHTYAYTSFPSDKKILEGQFKGFRF